MPSVFEALPGMEVPVGAIATSLAEMWTDGTGVTGEGSIEADDAKATQVNFVLHLGRYTTPEDAVAQFRTTLEFSQRYPSRVVVLCPLEDDVGQTDLRAKVYGECHLGRTKNDKRCVEFVILSYPRAARQHLENQASICLSTDLPLFYWAHRFTDSARLAAYRYLLTRAKRVLIDSATAPEGAMEYPWPRPENVRDLVYARLLPIRQSLGQFLSRYAFPLLCAGLQRVTLTYDPAHAAEAKVLLVWVRDRLGKCGDTEAEFTLVPRPAGTEDSFDLVYAYESAKSFRWRGNLATGQAQFEAAFGGGRTSLAASVSLLPPVTMLSEAMFF